MSEPARIATPIWNKGEELIAKPFTSPLSDLAEKIGRHAIDSGNKKGISPVEVAKAVHHEFVVKRPKDRYLVAKDKMKYRLIRHLPARTIDSLVPKEMRRMNEE